MDLRPLRLGDDRSSFKSGQVDLDRFFHLFAGQNQFRNHLGVTYVAVEDGRILAYATIAAGQLEGDRLPASLRRRLPDYPLPVLRLARLAVGEAFQGKRLGETMLHFVLTLAQDMTRKFGCVGVITDAKTQAVDFYRHYGFIPLDVVKGSLNSRPLPLTMFLPIKAVLSQLKAP